jgi:cell fate regulator YaaT (PSP1 superfamily)
MSDKNNEKKKNNNRHHGRNHNRGKSGGDKKPKKPQEQPLEAVLPELEFNSPSILKKEEAPAKPEKEVTLSKEVLAEIEADIIPPIIRQVDPVIKTEVPVEDDSEKVDIIGVRFKKTGKVYYFEPNGCTAKRGEHAIVDTARGPEFGEVWIPNRKVPHPR